MFPIKRVTSGYLCEKFSCLSQVILSASFLGSSSLPRFRSVAESSTNESVQLRISAASVPKRADKRPGPSAVHDSSIKRPNHTSQCVVAMATLLDYVVNEVKNLLVV